MGHTGNECERVSDELGWVFSLLGKRWTGLVLGALMSGPIHFAELRRAIPGISERMLSDRLTELAEGGLVEREVIEGPPIGVRYRLTAAGLALRPSLDSLSAWALAHFNPSSCPSLAGPSAESAAPAAQPAQ